MKNAPLIYYFQIDLFQLQAGTSIKNELSGLWRQKSHRRKDTHLCIFRSIRFSIFRSLNKIFALGIFIFLIHIGARIVRKTTGLFSNEFLNERRQRQKKRPYFHIFRLRSNRKNAVEIALDQMNEKLKIISERTGL